MSDHLSDLENANLFRHIDIMGSSSSVVNSSSNATREEIEHRAKTLDYISEISDIPSPDRPAVLTSQAREGAGQLEQILAIGPATRSDIAFIEELNRLAQT